MRVGMLTREYPPEVYGGAGVHVDFLSRSLAAVPGVEVEVHCMGADRGDVGPIRVVAHRPPADLAGANPALATLGTDLSIANAVGGCDLLHSHTWYASIAGHVGSLLHGLPHVVTCHSLEPLRPWKAEQLGGGYAVSSWAERTAVEGAALVVAVSNGMRTDILAAYPGVDPARVRVVHNGIDTQLYAEDPATDVLERLGVDPARPSIVFVGRITRQKGLPGLLRAVRSLDPAAQLVLCAGAADTPELGAEVEALVAELAAAREGVLWVKEMLPVPDVVQLLSHATAFVCPSVYEPLGIVNLEAMACGTAVVASAVGGIPEVVDDGVTGLLVPPTDDFGPLYEEALAAALNALVADPARAAAMGAAGRARAVAEFGWDAVAEQTAALYAEVLADHRVLDSASG